MLEATLLRPSLIRPVVDLLLNRLDRRRRRRLRRGADVVLREAIRELLLAQPDERRVEAKIAQARAAGALTRETALAEAMLARHRETRASTTGKIHRSRRLSWTA
jgi:hypothetical protein